MIYINIFLETSMLFLTYTRYLTLENDKIIKVFQGKDIIFIVFQFFIGTIQVFYTHTRICVCFYILFNLSKYSIILIINMIINIII